MKCDVCDTKIPIGQHQCPNCGYKIPVKKVNTFNATSTTHEHIESSKESNQRKTTSFSGTEMSLQDKIEELKKNPRISFDFFKLGANPELGKVAKIIIGVVIFLAVITFGVTSIINEMDYNRYDTLSFQGVIDKGYDDGSAQKALDFKNQIVKEYEATGIKEIETSEYCDDNGGLIADVIIHGYYEGILYQVSGTFQGDQQVSKNIFISGDSKKSLIDEFQGDKKVISRLGKVLGSDKLVKVIDEGRGKLIQDKDEDVLVYKNVSPYIYITQDQRDSKDLYYFTIMYDFFN